MDIEQLRLVIERALKEDVDQGDVTSMWTLPPDTIARGRIVAHEAGAVAGIAVAQEVFRRVNALIAFTPLMSDGAEVFVGDELAAVVGPATGVFTAERTALNFVERMSGIATLTRRFVDAVACTPATILDTRKTLPGWRELEKHAVACGGGTNHRIGLYDMVLIKDNHLAAAGSVTTAFEACRDAGVPVEVEVIDFAQLCEALDAGAKRILLDNMTLFQMRRAVLLSQRRAQLEASGNITLRRVRAVAETGVDYISVGAITHSAPATDIALDLLSG